MADCWVYGCARLLGSTPITFGLVGIEMINLYTADCVSAFQMILDPHPILNILGSCGFLSRLP